MAEALGLHYGVFATLRLDYKKIEIEGNNSRIVNAIKGSWSCPWEVELILADVLASLKLFEKWSIKHVFREINLIADQVANMTLLNQPFDAAAHIRLEDLIRLDALGRSTSR